MSEGRRRVGFFGGSFNPIHNGHIALATAIKNLCHLDEVWLVVTPLNPFKVNDSSLLGDKERLLLVQTALKGHEGLVASDYEFYLPRPSYTFDTLERLSADYSKTDFVMIIGADNWLSWNRWYRSKELLERYEIIVYPREGFPIDASTLPKGVTLVNTPLYNVSSSEIRKRVAAGLDVSSLVPWSILPMVERLYNKQGGRTFARSPDGTSKH